MNITLKYIDPTYVIRSCASNANDTITCAKLAQNAVHGSMTGYTGFSVGIVRNALAYIPIQTLNEAGSNRVSINDRTWLRLMAACRQKSMVNGKDHGELVEKLVKERS